MDIELDTRPTKRKIPLPPVQRHPGYYKDPFKNSVLLTHNLQHQREKKLKKIMQVFREIHRKVTLNFNLLKPDLTMQLQI